MQQALEEVIAAARALTADDRRLLVQVLMTSLGAGDTVAANAEDFWAMRSLGEIAAAQSTQPVRDVATLVADFWPEEESAEEFNQYIYGQRRRDQSNGQ